jgi:large subunit ribosomal protein L17
MRHGKKQKKFRREMGHRIALFRNLATELFRYGRIRTGLEKAKYLRGVVEPLITRAKTDSVHNRREAAKTIQQPDILKKLYVEIAPLFKERKGGYTRILKLSPRPGDCADMAFIELVGAEAIYKKEEPKQEKTKEVKQPKEPKAKKAVEKKEDKKEKKEADKKVKK